jgi:TRAP-type C4-dicarboxylate transport system permease small subunit
MQMLATLDHAVGRALRWFIVAGLAIVLVLIALGILVRIVPVFSMSGYDEIIELLIAWMTFAGAVALWREGALFKIDLFSAMSPPVAKGIDTLAMLLSLLFALVFTIKGWQFASGTIETLPFLFISKMGWYASMPVCGALMTAYALVGLYRAIAAKPAA